MSKIISFAYTSWPLIAGVKTVTRRSWKEDYAKRFSAGDVIHAYDRSPRFGGKKIATIELTKKPYLEHLSKMPDDDYEKEGLKWLDENQQFIPIFNRIDFYKWRKEDYFMWVVRYKIVSVSENSILELNRLIGG
jgi:hypothetical protein